MYWSRDLKHRGDKSLDLSSFIIKKIRYFNNLEWINKPEI